jgi:hypothetical protein
MTTTYEEFLERTEVLESGCRVPVSKRWPGKNLKLTWDGYTQVTVDGKRARSHRMAWELKNGPVPEGMMLDHKCRYTPCCEVEHLEVVTPSENVLRGDLPEIAREHMKRVSAQRRRCRECPMESNPAGISHHQRATGHTGWEQL